MESDEDWVLLDSDNPADDDDRVLALSSSCSTPDASDDEDEVVGDDGEGLYDLEDAEEDEQLRPPLPKPLSGLFHHTPSRAASYAAFDALHSAKQLIPDPSFSVFPEEVTVLASTRGLVCLRGRTTGLYYIANPVTFKRVRLPSHNREHGAFGDPAVVITFDEPCFDDDIDHYHVVVTFSIGDGIFVFESFSSRTWEWRVGSEICAVEHVVSASGVGALGLAFWRTTIGYILCYNPEAGCPDMIFAPPEVEHRPLWELGEMEGNLCVTCMDERVNDVAVLRYLNPGAGEVPWAWAGLFDGCKLRNREGVTLLRSQGGVEVVMFDPQAEIVVAMDLEGRTSRTIGYLEGGKYYADFIPYVSSITEISRHRALPLLASVVVATSAEDILTPMADSPLGSFEGNSLASDDAVPVGAPTMTKPKPGAAEEATPASSASFGGVVAHIGGVAALAAGALASGRHAKGKRK